MGTPGKALAKLRALKLREDDRKKLAALRAEVKAARARRAAAMRRTVATCKRGRAMAREAVKAFRKRALDAIRAEVRSLRGSARNRCQLRKYKIRQAGGGLLAKQRAQLAEERRLQAQLRGYAVAAKKRAARVKTSSRERVAESDDYVRGNLPPELAQVFNKVKRTIKGGPRTTRTEAFLEWAESHPEDVLRYQADDTDREVARLVAEHERVSSRLRKGPTHYRKIASGEVPF